MIAPRILRYIDAYRSCSILLILSSLPRQTKNDFSSLTDCFLVSFLFGDQCLPTLFKIELFDKCYWFVLFVVLNTKSNLMLIVENLSGFSWFTCFATVFDSCKIYFLLHKEVIDRAWVQNGFCWPGTCEGGFSCFHRKHLCSICNFHVSNLDCDRKRELGGFIIFFFFQQK